MAALAGMLQAARLRVTGSDENVYPPMSTLLERLGIPVLEGYRADNLAPRPDLVVIGNKVSRDNAEVQAVLAAGLPYLSLPEALGRAVPRRPAVAGGGGHARQDDVDGDAGLGARSAPAAIRACWSAATASTSAATSSSAPAPHFVIEGDEYDSAFFDKGPKFLHYRPSAAILTAVEFDHADIYRDLEAVKAAFRAFVGAAAGGRAAGRRQRLSARARGRADRPRARDDLRPRGRAPNGESSTCATSGGRLAFSRATPRPRRGGADACRVPGAINALNALGVYVLARELGLDAWRDRRRAGELSRRRPPPGAGRRVRRRDRHRRLRASPDRRGGHAGGAPRRAIRAGACGGCSSRAPTPAGGGSSSASMSPHSLPRIA